MPELGAIEQHDARCVLLPRAATAAQDRLAAHVATEQLPYVADSENIWIDYDRAALVAHQLRRHEAQGREGLEVIITPRALHAFAKVDQAIFVEEKGIIFLVHDPDVEGTRIHRVPLERV